MKLQDFFERLKVEVDLLPLASDQLEHFAHLTQRTAEFHLTGVERSTEEVRQLQESGSAECWAIEVRDRFGNYGVAGGVIFSVESGVLDLDTFLMNCRVMGKKVEYITLQKLARMARERSCAEVRLKYRFTPRNAPAAKFVRRVGAQSIEFEASGYSVTLPVEIIEALVAPVDVEAQPVVQSIETRTYPLMEFLAARCLAFDTKSKSDLFAAIGTSFQSAEQILEAVTSYNRHARLLEEGFVAPRTETERAIALLWQKLLNVERVGIHNNFFELGGHSLLATQVVSRLRETFKVEIALRSLFEAPTVAGLARSIESAIRAGRGLQSPPITRVSRDRDLPLSFGQQRLWFLEKLSPANSPYRITEALSLRGPLNVAVLEDCINKIVNRHESLRTTFPMVNGKPVQAIAPSLTLTIPVIELEGVTESDRRDAALRLMTEEARLPFDLAEGPLLRIALLRVDEEDHIALVMMHHAISDAWSIAVLVRELIALYKASLDGQLLRLPELPIQYADFAHWQRRWLDGEVLERYVDHWKQKLFGLPTVLELPADHTRPPVQNFRGAQQSFQLSKQLGDSIKSLSEREGVTLFMALLSAFKTLLHYYTGRDDMVVGVDVANRTRTETEELIGFFVNQLVLRTDLSGNPSFREVLRRVRDVSLEAYAYQDLPFDRLVEALNPQRDLSRNPLFQVMFGLQNVPIPTLDLPGVQLSGMEIPVTQAVFDLTLYMTDTAQGVFGSLRYNAELFEPATISRMAKLFEILLESIVAKPNLTLSALEAALSRFERQHGIEQQKQVEQMSLKKLKNVKRKAVNV